MARTTQTTNALFEDVRDSYISRYQGEQTRLASLGEDPFSEPVLRDNCGAILRGGVFNLPQRRDFLLMKSGKLIDWQPQHVPQAGATALGYEANVAVSRFAWNDLRIDLPRGEVKRLCPLRNWYLEWFQTRRVQNAAGLRGAVHRITGPIITDQRMGFEIDLGTAPVEALHDLIDVFAQIRTETARLRTPLET